MELFWLDKVRHCVVVYKIVRDCKTRWFVGGAFARGGYINKPKSGGPQKYTTDINEISRQMKEHLKEALLNKENELLLMRMAADLIEEGSLDVWKAGKGQFTPATKKIYEFTEPLDMDEDDDYTF